MTSAVARRTGRQAARTGAIAAALLALAGVLVVRPHRVVVAGRSMEPALWDGDRLLVGLGGAAKVGDIAALRDPTDRRRLVVKRVVAVRLDEVVVRGDNVAESVDSRSYGPVPRRNVVGKMLRRYGRAQPVAKTV